MIKTRNIITRFCEVNEVWCFEYYLQPFGMDQKLEGQSVNILSPLNKEKTPSFFLFYQSDDQGNGRYFFKDYSSGASGDVYSLVKSLFGYRNKGQAVDRLWGDYQAHLNGTNRTWTEHNHNTQILYKEGSPRYVVSNIELRRWQKCDADYWLPYRITSHILEHYNVAAVKSVLMRKAEKDRVKEFKIERPLLYAYYNKFGDPYFLYQPHNKVKFLKLRNWTMGVDQLTGAENILITKSLKDCMGFRALGIPQWDVISPPSENSLLPSDVYLTHVKPRHKKATLFDNDRAGASAYVLYNATYGIGGVVLSGEKDLTDNVKARGWKTVKNELQHLLNDKT